MRQNKLGATGLLQMAVALLCLHWPSVVSAQTDTAAITRREFLSSCGAAALAQGRRPNVLLVMADDLGYECLSVNGSTSYKTPNLDEMARTGVRFTHAFAQPLCTPTRLQLMTGQHNFRNWRSFGVMDPSEKTFGHMMRRAGVQQIRARRQTGLLRPGQANERALFLLCADRQGWAPRSSGPLNWPQCSTLNPGQY